MLRVHRPEGEDAGGGDVELVASQAYSLSMQPLVNLNQKASMDLWDVLFLVYASI